MDKAGLAKYNNAAIHVAIWISLMAVPEIVLHNIPVDTGLPRGFFLLTNLYHIGLFYLNASLLYPRLLNKRLWWLYLPALAAVLVLSYQLKLGGLHVLDPQFQLSSFNRRILFFPPIPFLVASIFYRIIRDRIDFGRREKEIRTEQMASELKFLRAQISPHFLFNTLTNMVALARKKSDLLEPSLIKLSDLLRYMLYQSAQDRTTLVEEIGYLRDYIELQQLRFSDHLTVTVDLPDEIPEFYLEPMLLIPFVENAFKHGTGKAQDPFLRVSLQVHENTLSFGVINSRGAEGVQKDTSLGIGLENVRNRLLLLYPRTHELVIRETEAVFEITLKIELA